MYKYVFVILVYRNTDDLEECLVSIKSHVESYRVIIVNAYYDDKSRTECKRIANSYDCDFLNIENRGYSFGNNKGIEYALNHYEFDHLIISNPDIEILAFDDSNINSLTYDIFAPSIRTLNQRNQNPMRVKDSKYVNKLFYKGFKHGYNPYIYSAILISKISRVYNMIINKIRRRLIYPIYCAHGSFVILSKRAIKMLLPVYDENMFLFAEEGVLAKKAAKAGLRTCFYSPISIRHKEDGSMKLSDMSVNKMLRDANIYYYEHYEM